MMTTQRRFPWGGSGIDFPIAQICSPVQTARAALQKRRPCPAIGKTSGPCRGYVVEPVQPLRRGGAEAPGNMQWQTRRAAKEKDKGE